MLILGASIAFYHAGVQYGLISDFCKFSSQVKNITEFKSILQESRPCSEISWSIFGLSVSLLNGFFLIGFLIFDLIRWKTKSPLSRVYRKFIHRINFEIFHNPQ